MALLLSLVAIFGRFGGKVLTKTLDWAGALLFGRVAGARHVVLTAMSLASIAWLVAALGVALPDLGTWLLVALPLPPGVDRDAVRVAMLAVVVVLPAFIGAASLFLVEPAARPHGFAIAGRVIRGYPFAFALAVALFVVAVVAIAHRVRSLPRHWTDAHIPIAVRPDGYDRVADDLEESLRGAGLDVRRRDAPRTIELPSKLLRAIAGPDAAPLIPLRLIELATPTLEVRIYPFDVTLSGRRADVVRARAAIADRLGVTAAYLTTGAEAQAVEDRLEALAGRLQVARGEGTRAEVLPTAARAAAVAELRDLERTLATLDLSYEDWEVLRRESLQLERLV